MEIRKQLGLGRPRAEDLAGILEREAASEGAEQKAGDGESVPWLTVVIPNYNGEDCLEGCLESIYHGGQESVSVIVVDNGSADGSASRAKARFPQAEYIFLPVNTGFAKAANVGVEAAKTPYVFLLNNDTALEPGAIAALGRALARQPRAFAIQALMLDWSDGRLVDGGGDAYTPLGHAYARGKGGPAARFAQMEEIFSCCAGAAVYHRQAFAALGGFDESHFAYLEDVDLGYRARLCGGRSYLAPEAGVRHKGSATSGSRHNAFKVGLSGANNIYLLWKNMPYWQLLWNLPFLAFGLALKWAFFASKGLGGDYGRALRRGVEICRQSGASSRAGALLSYLGRRQRCRRHWHAQGWLYRGLADLLRGRA